MNLSPIVEMAVVQKLLGPAQNDPKVHGRG